MEWKARSKPEEKDGRCLVCGGKITRNKCPMDCWKWRGEVIRKVMISRQIRDLETEKTS